MTADLAMMPAYELVKLFKARKASPVEATRAAIVRIDALNPQLNAFQHLDPDSALRAARASEKRWKKGGKRLSDIDGVPITIKDMVLTKGMPTRMGSAATDENGPWNVDSPVAQRLREEREKPVARPVPVRRGAVEEAVATVGAATCEAWGQHSWVRRCRRRMRRRLPYVRSTYLWRKRSAL